MEEGKLIVSDAFDKGLFYKEIKRNFSPAASPSSVLLEAKFIEPKKIKISYLEGPEYEEKKEIIDLNDNYDWPFYGKWIVTKTIAHMPIYAMDEKDIKNFIGKKAFYSNKRAEFDNESCESPIYKEMVISETKFFEDTRIQLKDLDIKSKSVKIVQLENNWVNPGSYLIIKNDDKIIILWDGVFFEMERYLK